MKLSPTPAVVISEPALADVTLPHWEVHHSPPKLVPADLCGVWPACLLTAPEGTGGPPHWARRLGPLAGCRDIALPLIAAEKGCTVKELVAKVKEAEGPLCTGTRVWRRGPAGVWVGVHDGGRSPVWVHVILRPFFFSGSPWADCRVVTCNLFALPPPQWVHWGQDIKHLAFDSSLLWSVNPIHQCQAFPGIDLGHPSRNE